MVETTHLKWKLRVVFNASRLTSAKQSLNDFLQTGPALKNELGLVLLNWRRYRIVFTAVMVKMFRQILVHPDDRDLQRTIWRPKPGVSPAEYRLKPVTYGTACALYLAIRTFRHAGTQFPLGAAFKITFMWMISFMGLMTTLQQKRREINLLSCYANNSMLTAPVLGRFITRIRR